MNLKEAVSSVLSKYADFTGRARRSEYWFWFLAVIIGAIVTSIIDSIIGAPITYVVFMLGILVPNIAVSIRRMHDIGKSGWWILVGLIPFIGAIILIVWFVGDSQPDNEYGPNPKGGSGSAASDVPPAYNTPPPPAPGTPPPPAPGTPPPPVI
ncbi:MAG: DUF805 domain-containing protein [Aeromicrobium sp.]